MRHEKRSELIIQPAAGEPWLEMGGDLYENNDWLGAIRYLDRACVLAPSVEAATYYRAAALARLDRQSDVAISLGKYLSRHAPSSRILALLGRAHFRLRGYDLALKAFEMARAGNDDSGSLAGWAGKCHVRLGDYQSAYLAFRDALDKGPGNAEIVLAQSAVLFQLDRHSDAAATLEAHLSRYTISSRMLVILGMARFRLNAIDLALEAFEKARAAGDASAGLMSWIGQCHTKLFHYEKAVLAFREALESDPENGEARAMLAQCLFERQEFEEARTHCLSVTAPAESVAKAHDILAAIERIKDGGGTAKVARWPRARTLFNDLRRVSRDFILSDVHPASIDLTARTRVVTLGSCFAENLAGGLSALGVGTEHIGFAEILNSTYANRYFLDWLYELGEFEDHYKGFSEYFYEMDKIKTRDIFDAADLFVYTLGVAPCLFDSKTDSFVFQAKSTEISMRGLSKRYRFRTTTVEENFANMRAVANTLLARKADARLVYTVSPVPLNASFEYNSPLVADCVSKSILRTAADQLARTNDPRLVYWPSFEMVRWLGAHVPQSFYGEDDGNTRHVNNEHVRMIVQLFVETFGDAEMVGLLDKPRYTKFR